MGEPTDNPNLEKMYLDALNGPPLESDDLTFIIDCPDNEILFEYKNFEPKVILKLLIARASSSSIDTPPAKFHEEMNELITLKEKSPDERSSEDSSRLTDLTEKYNIVFDSSCHKPDVITYQRVTFTLPHYFLPLKGQQFKNRPEIPPLFQYPQFGGLIPSRNSKDLAIDVKKSILKVHIFCMLWRKPYLPLRTGLVLLRKRIESGVLSDDRRFRFLQNHGVITLNGDLSKMTKTVYETILTEHTSPLGIDKDVRFKDTVNEIPWSLLFE